MIITKRWVGTSFSSFFVLISLFIFLVDIKTRARNNNLEGVLSIENTSITEEGITNASEYDKLTIYTSFYPLYDFVKKIGTDMVDVSTIVPSGTEPHDFEPTPKQIIDLQNADMILFNGIGFESWINIIKDLPLVDFSKSIESKLDENVQDLHIWLDRLLVKNVSKTIINISISLDPKNGNHFESNYNKFKAEQEKLDNNTNINLTDCTSNDFIAFHDAFNSFAKRYELTQHSLGGNVPESDLSSTIANEIEGGKVLVLNPIETLSQEDQQSSKDYISKMNVNLDNLKIALKRK